MRKHANKQKQTKNMLEDKEPIPAPHTLGLRSQAAVLKKKDSVDCILAHMSLY